MNALLYTGIVSVKPIQIVQTNTRWYFKPEYKNILRPGVGLYLVSKCAILQFCYRMFIYCATSELLTEALVIRDGRTVARM